MQNFYRFLQLIIDFDFVKQFRKENINEVHFHLVKALSSKNKDLFIYVIEILRCFLKTSEFRASFFFFKLWGESFLDVRNRLMLSNLPLSNEFRIVLLMQ